jgi:hypothetical protein
MTGEPLPPLLPNVAAAQAAGAIGADHIRVIRRFFTDLPSAVDFETRQQCEATLARIAAEHTPDALRKAAERLMALVHPDAVFAKWAAPPCAIPTTRARVWMVRPARRRSRAICAARPNAITTR